MTGELGHGRAERQGLPVWVAGLIQSLGSAQGEHEARQRDYMWRMQFEHTLEQLGVQLRASQTENQRLRQERQELMAALEKKESSSHGTPEEKSAEVLYVEDGAAARQDRKIQDGAAVPDASNAAIISTWWTDRAECNPLCTPSTSRGIFSGIGNSAAAEVEKEGIGSWSFHSR